MPSTTIVRFENVGDDTNRVREFIERREHALKGTLGEIAVADLATARSAHRANFASRERWEVVMKHERLRRLAASSIESRR
jgi:hypothetical protein